MEQLNFSLEKITEYYDSRFNKDLKAIFATEQIDGAEYVRSIQFTSIFDLQQAEEEIMCIALISFMFATESTLSRRCHGISEHNLATAMNTFGFPWLRSVASSLDRFLGVLEETKYLQTKDEFYATRDAMTYVEQFMSHKLIPSLQILDNSSIEARIFHSSIPFSSDIHETIIEGFRAFYRMKFYAYAGLTGLEFTHREFEDYYLNRFPQQLKEYFSSAKESDGYLHILDVQHSSNRRWDDGSPASNVKDNYMFAAIFLFMTLAEQSILKYAKESEHDFHQCTGWPLIYSGPGAGPYLHPLYMLEYAGLSPKKYEAPLLAEVTKHIFPYLIENMNAILNGHELMMKDSVAGQRLLKAIRNRRLPLIKKYLTLGAEEIQNLLSTWYTSPAQKWQDVLDNRGVLQME